MSRAISRHYRGFNTFKTVECRVEQNGCKILRWHGRNIRSHVSSCHLFLVYWRLIFFFIWTTWAAVQYPADESAEETFAVVRLTAPSCADDKGWHADQNAAEQRLAMIKDYLTLGIQTSILILIFSLHFPRNDDVAGSLVPQYIILCSLYRHRMNKNRLITCIFRIFMPILVID